MDPFDEVLEQYIHPEFTDDEKRKIEEEAHEHLVEYLVGDGEIYHLHEYNELMDKIQ
jgi:hypothetical protein